MADFNTLALAEHAWNCGHSVDWENTVVISKVSNLHVHLALESFHICTNAVS